MAVRIPSQSEIEQFLYNIDELEGYSYAEYLDYMEEVYPEVDAAELYKSKGKNIVTGYRDIQGNFVAGEKPEIDPDVMAMIKGMPTGIDRMNQEIAASAEEIDALPLTQAEKSAAFIERLKERKLAEDLQEEESVARAVADGMGDSLDSLVARGQQIAEDYAYKPIPATGRVVDNRMAKSNLGEQGMLLNLTDEEQEIYDADLPLRQELIPGDTIIEDMVASAAESMDLPPWAMAVAGAVATKGKSLTKKKSTVKEKKQDDLFKQDGMVTKTKPAVKAKTASQTVSKEKLNPNTVEGMIAAQTAKNAAKAGNSKKVETVIARGNKPEGKGFKRIDAEDVAKVKAATILGTFQATLTNFRYLTSKWKHNTEEESLLGVSLTGIMDNKDMINGKINLDKLKNVSIDLNKVWAKKLGIPQSAAITCVKPSGTVSQLVDSASGIHTRHSPYYLRTVRADKKDPLARMMVDAGVYHEDDLTKPEHTYVFYFPMKSPKGALTRKDLSATEHLEVWKDYQDKWCEHKPSVTISVKEDEWLEVGAWVYKNFDDISGISFLPYSDHSYKQAPYQEITYNEYRKWLKKTTDVVDWSKITEYETEDNTENTKELACSAGTCEII
jgi:hypothetical protein